MGKDQTQATNVVAVSQCRTISEVGGVRHPLQVDYRLLLLWTGHCRHAGLSHMSATTDVGTEHNKTVMHVCSHRKEGRQTGHRRHTHLSHIRAATDVGTAGQSTLATGGTIYAIG